MTKEGYSPQTQEGEIVCLYGNVGCIANHPFTPSAPHKDPITRCVFK